MFLVIQKEEGVSIHGNLGEKTKMYLSKYRVEFCSFSQFLMQKFIRKIIGGNTQK
jgi:hypothetical protein